jgi:hypothetical protein
MLTPKRSTLILAVNAGWLLLAATVSPCAAFAADEPPASESGAGPAASTGEPPAAVETEAPAAKPKKSKGRYVREKENDGTEARNRFRDDTVLKSKYELNGQSLEVDPD